jgi:hypothetical protein
LGLQVGQEDHAKTTRNDKKSRRIKGIKYSESSTTRQRTQKLGSNPNHKAAEGGNHKTTKENWVEI